MDKINLLVVLQPSIDPKQLIGGYSEFKDKNPLRYIKNAWITLEVFNLFQIYNTVSYT